MRFNLCEQSHLHDKRWRRVPTDSKGTPTLSLLWILATMEWQCWGEGGIWVARNSSLSSKKNQKFSFISVKGNSVRVTHETWNVLSLTFLRWNVELCPTAKYLLITGAIRFFSLIKRDRKCVTGSRQMTHSLLCRINQTNSFTRWRWGDCFLSQHEI